MEQFKIEIATLDDVEELAILHIQLRKTEKKYDSNLIEVENIKDREAKFCEFLSKDKAVCYIARLEGKSVGYLSGYIIDEPSVYQEIVARLNEIVVDEKYRGKGIGQKLILQFEKWCTDNMVKYINLSAFNDNENAMSVYRKIGFEDYSVGLIKKI